MTASQIVTLLLVLATVLAVAKASGALFARCGQPAVIGELVAGVLLGPTLLPAALERILFPADLQPVFTALGDLGVALFMFLIGQEFRRHPPRRQAGAVLATTAGSVAVPFGPSVVTGEPAPGPWRHGTATGVPPGNGTVFVTWRPVTTTEAPTPTTSMRLLRAVPLTITVSAAPSPTPLPGWADRSIATCFVAVPDRSLTVMVSAPRPVP